jgi:hypothetical protein
MRLVLTAIVALVLAAAGGANAGGGGSATGGSHLTVHNVFGLQTLELQHFSFAARTTSDGADGWFSYGEVDDGVLYTAGGPVTCLTVIGGDAWIGGVITQSNDQGSIGLGAWWHVTDNGSGVGAPADITTFLGVGTLEKTQAFCDSHPAYRFPFAIDGGNIDVRG